MAQNTEIERKFLVKDERFKAEAVGSYEIYQGYLCREKGKTIRIRIRDDRGFLTIKSSALRAGLARFEWEKEIDIADAREMLSLCEPGLIHKTRYIIPAPPCGEEARAWEVDVFHERLEGLVLAELELGAEDEAFEKPAWVGEEVTGDPRYYNANM